MTTEKTIISVPPRDQPETDSANAWIVLIYGGDLGKRFQITTETTVGRGDSNSVVLDMPNVSRHHARFFFKEGGFLVEDLGSTNGTFVNDTEILDQHTLSNGDLITTGGAVFKFIFGGNVEALYHEEIYRLAILDGLTGVHNKRFLLEFLDRELARASRHERPLSLALIDLDHFKDLNDSFGHLAGDSVLKAVARIMAAGVRREELLARYGGEEFALVLPEIDAECSVVFCERIRKEIEEHVFTFDQKEMSVTVSIGIASLTPGTNAKSLIQSADAVLYQAKREGRNRVLSGAGEETNL